MAFLAVLVWTVVGAIAVSASAWATLDAYKDYRAINILNIVDGRRRLAILLFKHTIINTIALLLFTIAGGILLLLSVHHELEGHRVVANILIATVGVLVAINIFADVLIRRKT